MLKRLACMVVALFALTAITPDALAQRRGGVRENESREGKRVITDIDRLRG